MEVTFYGVRGSVPCSCELTRNVGGNTSCVTVNIDGEAPIVLDCGTGLRYLGDELMRDNDGLPFTGTALVSHLHWDHVQGLPFFVPVLQEGASLTLVGPTQLEGSLIDQLGQFIQPPLFPVRLNELPGEVSVLEHSDGGFSIGSAEVTVAPVPHIGPTNGYRIDHCGRSVVYVPDHQQPAADSTEIDPRVLELCADADLLIHDAQYDDEEFRAKADWGHSTVGYAAEVARRAGVRALALFHHDPSHGDEWIEWAVEHARARAGAGTEVFVAAEGLTVGLGDRITCRSSTLSS